MEYANRPRFSSRADSERSPLHDVKQHAHAQANPDGRESFFILDEQGVPDGSACERLVTAACAGGRYAAADRAAINRPHWLGPHDPETCNRQSGGARRDRTDDLLLAKQALSQLSYGPFRDQKSVIGDQDVASLMTDY
jgi:hypothetical protein